MMNNETWRQEGTEKKEISVPSGLCVKSKNMQRQRLQKLNLWADFGRAKQQRTLSEPRANQHRDSKIEEKDLSKTYDDK
ncbi:MAG: hypothetical protein LBD27_05315 [Tannerella sp.]|jgi:hypothetical protein|nr:hypothetical protein [Tannerella sp.]